MERCWKVEDLERWEAVGDHQYEEDLGMINRGELAASQNYQLGSQNFKMFRFNNFYSSQIYEISQEIV